MSLPTLEEPFTDAAQQHKADMMGMYVFLASEIMLFGGLFAGILVYRLLHHAEVIEASRRLHLWISALNTVVLLTSSLCVALAVQAARQALRSLTSGFLGAAVLLGAAFLGLKAVEYRMEYQEGLLPVPGAVHRFSGPVEHLFMDLYLVATSLHAVHLTVGMVVLLTVMGKLKRHTLSLPQDATTVEIVGLYWHLVDIVWVFLYPVLYLAR